jgi:hypothetical protein
VHDVRYRPVSILLLSIRWQGMANTPREGMLPGARHDSDRAKRLWLAEPTATKPPGTSPGDRVEALGNFGKPSGVLGTVPIAIGLWQPVTSDKHSTASQSCGELPALAQWQERSSTRLLTRMFSVTDLSCHRGLHFLTLP